MLEILLVILIIMAFGGSLAIPAAGNLLYIVLAVLVIILLIRLVQGTLQV